MAKSAEKDEHEDKDDAADEAPEGEAKAAGDKAEEKAEAKAEEKAGDKAEEKAEAKAGDKAEEKAGDKAEEKAGDKAEEKAEAKTGEKAGKAKAGDKAEEEEKAEAEAEAPRKPAAKKVAKSGKARARGQGARGRASAGAQQGSSLGKSMILFVVIIGGLAAGFAILGRDEQQAPAKPKWSVGQTVDVEITLVKSDKTDLACSSTEEIAGRHCGFEAMNKPWSKGGAEDKLLLKPYTTTDRIQFAAAGVWSDPALATSVPGSRFSLKCKYKVEGSLKNLAVRWDPAGQWFPQTDWFAGSVSACKVAQ